MDDRYVRETGSGSWVLGNRSFELAVTERSGEPVLSRLIQVSQPDVDWAAGAPLAPVVALRAAGEAPGRASGDADGRGLEVVIGAEFERVDLPADSRGAPRKESRAELRFTGAAIESVWHRGSGAQALRLDYESPSLRVHHYLAPARELPAWRSWTRVAPAGSEPVTGLVRFDAATLRFTTGSGEPDAAYLVGWLFGPRTNAPGRPPVPFPYPSWIPRLLYGRDRTPMLDDPPIEWDSPTMQLVRERLTRLPLRSGRRSTYDNYPWSAVRGPDRRSGFFVGFEWSGSWKMDLAHDGLTVSVEVGTAGNVHDLGPGTDGLTSPAAFIGLFSGDWDDAFNACRRYVRLEVLPPGVPDYPHFSLVPPAVRYHRDAASWRAAVDLAAEAGAEMANLGEISSWGAGGSPRGEDFSLGVGDYREDRNRFPDGVKQLCDYARSRGLKVLMGVEFERADIRAANLGDVPWKPEWLVHQDGGPYRSWCQHVFLICLGVREAADWALENISRKIEEFGVDWLEYDSNEWAVCDDPTHDHGSGDGEWAQIRGLYHVTRGLHERFPNLRIGNCAGGAQRGDFGLARYCTHMYSDDIQYPSTVCRKYSHGIGSLYPTGYVSQSLNPYPGEAPPGGWYDPDGSGSHRVALSPSRLAWRALNRMMAMLQVSYGPHELDGEQRSVLLRAMAFSRSIRPSLFGDRYVLIEPLPLRAPEHREPGAWEVYEHLSVDGGIVSVFFFRGMSPEPECSVRLRGLDPAASYRAEWYSGRAASTFGGEQLMREGLTCSLDETPSGDAVRLVRLGGEGSEPAAG